jgi:hypothetical protein
VLGLWPLDLICPGSAAWRDGSVGIALGSFGTSSPWGFGCGAMVGIYKCKDFSVGGRLICGKTGTV